MKHPFQFLRNAAVALLVLASLAFTDIASAAKIEVDVIIGPYGYVRVRNDVNTGGAVRKDSLGYYTDRVQRGERTYIFATPQSDESTVAQYGIWSGSIGRYVVGLVTANWTGWCWYHEYVVPTNTSISNLSVDIATNRRYSRYQLPIGTRNP